MHKRPFVAAPLLILVLGLTTLARAASPTLPELMGDYQFASGFRQAPTCDSILASLQTELNKSLEKFKSLAVPDKIKSVHFLADSVYRAVELVLNDNNLSQLAQLTRTRNVARGVVSRLNLLLPVARTSFSANSRELLVILNKMLPLTTVIRSLEPAQRRGLIAFHKAVLTAAPDPSQEEKVDHALRALAWGNLALMEASLMMDSPDPVLRVDYALRNLHRAIAEDVLGLQMAAVLEPSFMVFHYTVRALPRFSDVELSIVDELLARFAKVGRHLDQTGADRFQATLAQIDQLLKNSQIGRLPKLHAELAAIRMEFAPPSGKRPN